MLPYFACLCLPSRGAFGQPLVFKGKCTNSYIGLFFFCWETATGHVLPRLGPPIGSRLILVKACNCLPCDKPSLRREGHARFLLNIVPIGISLSLSEVHPSPSLIQGCTFFNRDTNPYKEPNFTSSTFLLLLPNRARDGQFFIEDHCPCPKLFPSPSIAAVLLIGSNFSTLDSSFT